MIKLKRPNNQQSKEHAEFLMLGYFALIIRGYDNERSIPDPMLRKVWRYGKKVAKLNEVMK